MLKNIVKVICLIILAPAYLPIILFLGIAMILYLAWALPLTLLMATVIWCFSNKPFKECLKEGLMQL